jgi:hypothetical protein
MTALDTIKQIQGLIGTDQDGHFEGESRAALATLLAADPASPWPPVPGVHTVMASSFADPRDVAAFKACKAEGKSDQECFSVGDNGVGLWGDSTVEGSGPKCALPPEDWQAKWGPGEAARHKPVLVTRQLLDGTVLKVVCALDDTMPHKRDITNGAGIDLNPDACKALQLTPPVMARVTWQWADV